MEAFKQVPLGADHHRSCTCRAAMKQVLVHAGSCELEMQLVSEQVASPFWAALPPTNALRNMALELANTEANTT